MDVQVRTGLGAEKLGCGLGRLPAAKSATGGNHIDAPTCGGMLVGQAVPCD